MSFPELNTMFQVEKEQRSTKMIWTCPAPNCTALLLPQLISSLVLTCVHEFEESRWNSSAVLFQMFSRQILYFFFCFGNYYWICISVLKTAVWKCHPRGSQILPYVTNLENIQIVQHAGVEMGFHKRSGSQDSHPQKQTHKIMNPNLLSSYQWKLMICLFQ